MVVTGDSFNALYGAISDSVISSCKDAYRRVDTSTMVIAAVADRRFKRSSSPLVKRWRGDTERLCQDSQRMAQFLGDIKGQGILFIEQTTCGDQLIRNVKDVLVQNGFANALVTLGSEPSNVIISGAIQSGSAGIKRCLA